MKRVVKTKGGKQPGTESPPASIVPGQSAPAVAGGAKNARGYRCKCGLVFLSAKELGTHFVTDGRKEKGKHSSAGRVDITGSTEPVASPKIEQPAVTKHYTLRGIMLGVSAAGGLAGLGAFALYFTTQNLAAGGAGVILGFASAILFKYFWDKQDSVKTEHIGTVPTKKVNCLDLYYDEVVFEDFPGTNGDKPKGFLWECDNDHKKYWVNFNEGTKDKPKEPIPFVLPDQQFCDPGVFATRVLELPAHRRIFRRREKIGETIKTALLVLTIGIIWILIITTTGA